MSISKVFDLDDHGSLAVVICHFNPCLYSKSVVNLEHIAKWLLEERLPTYAVELRCGKSLQAPSILPVSHAKVVQLTSESIIFQKENLWNIAANILPQSFRYVLCLDADVMLIGHQWKEKLLHQLATAKLVQPFAKAIWTDSLGRPFKTKLSCGYATAIDSENSESGKLFHAGFAIACRREFWSETPGLYNGPLGEGASALMAAILRRTSTLRPYFENISTSFWVDYQRWAELLQSWTGTRLGYVDCEARHLWHGTSKNRKYIWHNPITDSRYLERLEWFKGFDPCTDLVRDITSGLIEWNVGAKREKKQMIKGIETYFEGRNEDEWFDSSASK